MNGSAARSPAPPRTARQALEHSTRSIHEALHHHPRLAPLLTPDLTIETYKSLLRDHRLFYHAVETERASRGWWPDLSLGGALSALTADLGAIKAGADGEAAQPYNVPTTTYRPNWTSAAMCLGGLYVLIGAQFGGRLIGSAVEETLPEAPRHYFAQRAESLPLWRSLLDHVEACGTDAARLKAMTHGAERMFADFGLFLSRS